MVKMQVEFSVVCKKCREDLSDESHSEIVVSRRRLRVVVPHCYVCAERVCTKGYDAGYKQALADAQEDHWESLDNTAKTDRPPEDD